MSKPADHRRNQGESGVQRHWRALATAALVLLASPAARADTVGTILPMLKDVPGLASLPVSNVTRTATQIEAKVTLHGKSVTVLGFKVSGANLGAVVPDTFALTDVVPVPSGTPIDGVSFKDVAFVYVPSNNKSLAVYAKAFPDQVKAALAHSGDRLTLKAGLNLFGEVDFASSGAVKSVLQSVGLSSFSFPLNASFPTTLFQHDPKTAAQNIKEQLLADLNLNLTLPELRIPGLPSTVKVTDANLKVVAPKIKGKSQREVFAGVTGDLQARVASKSLDFNFYILAQKPGSGASSTTLRGDTKSTVKIGNFTLSDLHLVAEKKSGQWSASIDAKSKVNGKELDVAATMPASGSPTLSIKSPVTLGELTSLKVPGLTDITLSDIEISKDILQAQTKVKAMTVDIATFKHNGKTLIAVSTPAAIHISDLIPQIGKTPLDDVSFDSMTYVWAPQGVDIKNFEATALPSIVADVAKKAATSFNIKTGLNVVGQLGIERNGDIGKMLASVGAYKSSLPLVGQLSPKVFQKGNASQLKNDILDALDLSIPLTVSGLHLPNTVQLKDTNLEIKGVKNGSKRGLDVAVRGELDAKVHNEQLAFAFDVDMKKQPGKPAAVVVSGETKPGTKLTIPLVQAFTLTDMTFEMKQDKGKWDWSVDAKSTLNNKPVEVTYALYEGRESSLLFKTKMTIAELVGVKGMPGLDDVELDTVMSRPGMWFLHGQVKGQNTYFQIQKNPNGPGHLVAAYLYSMPLTELIPGSESSPLKDVKFSNVVAYYYPGNKAVRASESGLRYDAGAWIAQSNKNNPVVRPGLNIYGHMDIHPTGELAGLLKEVGVSDLKLPLSGAFSPKAFAKNAGSLKNEILDHLDIELPLPDMKLPGSPSSVDIKRALLTVKGKDKKGNPGLRVDVAGRLDYAHGNSKAEFIFDVDAVRQGGRTHLSVSAEEVKGSKLVIDMLEKFELTDMVLGMNNADGGRWLVRLDASSMIRNTPIELVFARTPGVNDSIEITSKDLTIDKLIGQQGLPGLEDVALNDIRVYSAQRGLPAYIIVKGTVDGIATRMQVQKGWSRGHFVVVTLGDFDLGKVIPGTANSPLRDVKFTNVAMVYNPEASGALLNRTGLVHEAQSWIQQSNRNPTIQAGMNIFGHMDIKPSGELGKLLKDVGVTQLKLPLNGGFSPKALAKNVSAKEIENSILDHLDIKIDLPKLTIPGAGDHLTLSKERLEVKGKLPDGKRGLSVKVASDAEIKVKNEDIAFFIEVDYDRSQGAAATDLEIKGHTDRPWNKPFGISFLDLKELTLDIRKQKAADDQRDYSVDMAAKTDIGRHSALDVQIDIHEHNGKLTDAFFELDGPLKLSEIPDVKDIPEAGQFEINTLKVSEHGIEAKTDFGKNKDLDVYLFHGSGWNFILRQDHFAITEFIPPLSSTPLKHIKLSEAAMVLSKDGLKGRLTDYSVIAQDALKDIYGANAVEIDVEPGLSLVAAFEHKNASGGIDKALERLGLSEERVVLTGDIQGLFGGPVKLDVDVDLSAHSGAKHQPKWMKSKPGVEAVFSLIATENAGQFDVEIGIGADVVANMHGTELDFTTKTALEFEDEKIDVKIVADVKDKKGWKKPFGIPGLTVYEVGFDLGIDVEGAIHMGFDGNVKISGDEYKLAFDADLEGGAIPTDLALVASADKVDIFFIEEIAIAMMGAGFKLDIPENVFPTFTGVKFAFATPGAQDPDLNITGEGFALKGGMNWLDHDVGSMGLSINPTSGIAANGKINDITLGGILALKNNHFDLKANIKSVPSMKLNGDIDVLGLDDRVEVAVDKTGIKFKSSLSDGPSFKADIDFDVKYDVSAKKPDFKNADIFMSGDLHLDLKKFIQGPAVSALNTVIDDLNSGFADAEKALKTAEKKVDDLTTKINAEREKVRKERAKAEARLQSAEDRVNGIKSTIADDWHHYHHCHGWGKYVCKAKWGIKIGFEKGGLAIADEALKLAEEIVAHFPIDLDPRVAGLILERDGAKAALHLAEEAVKGVDFVDSFKSDADKILDEIGSAANISIKKASFEGDLKDVINGGPVDLALDVDLWGKTFGDSFAFYLKDVGKDVEHLAMMAYYALDHMVNDLLKDLPGFLKHKVRGLIASSMDSVEAEHKRRLAQFSTQFDKYHKTAGDIQTSLANYNQAYLQEQLSKSTSPLDSDTSETFSGELIEVGHSGLCLSSSQGQVYQQACNGNAAEKWSTKAVDGAPNVKPKAGYVQITDSSGSNCIVPEGTWKTVQAAFTDGSAPAAFNFGTTEFQGDGKINVSPCKNLKEFYWKILAHGDSWMQMANLASNKCLHFSHSSAKPGVAVAEWEACVGSANQVYRIADNASPKYYADYISLRNDQLGLCLGEADTDGTVSMADCTKAAYYDYMVDIRGYAKFINHHTGHCLQPGGYEKGSKMTEVPCTQLDYQWWDADPQAGGIIIKNAQTELCTNPPFNLDEVPPTQVDCSKRNNAVFAPVLGKYRFTGPKWKTVTPETFPPPADRYWTKPNGDNLCAFEVEGSYTPGVVASHDNKWVCATAFSDASAPERFSSGEYRLMMKVQDSDMLWYPNTGKKLSRYNMPTGGFGGASEANIYTCRVGDTSAIGWTADGKTCHVFNFAVSTPVAPATDFDILSRWNEAYYQLQGSAAADIEQPTVVPSFPLPPPVKTSPVWLVGTDKSPYAWNAKAYGWIRQKGCVTNITVDDTGVPYAIQCDDHIVKWTGTDWAKVGNLQAIDIGYGGRLYAIDKDSNPRKWNYGSWTYAPTCAKRIDVNYAGTPMIIACNGDVQHLSGNTWVSMNAGAGNKDIATGNQTWTLGESGKAWEYMNSKWHDNVGVQCFNRIDVAGDGNFWAIGCDGNIYAKDGNGSKKMPGRGLDIGMKWN